MNQKFTLTIFKKCCAMVFVVICLMFVGCGNGEDAVNETNTGTANALSDLTSEVIADVPESDISNDSGTISVIPDLNDKVTDNDDVEPDIAVTVIADQKSDPDKQTGVSRADKSDVNNKIGQNNRSESGNSGSSGKTETNNKPAVTDNGKDQPSVSPSIGDNITGDSDKPVITTHPLIQVLPDGGLLLPDDVWE